MHEDCQDCFFRNTICKGLNYRLFNRFFRNTISRKFQKGEVIHKQNEKSTHIHYLRSGKVKFCYEEGEQNIIITIDKAPTLLGLVNILNNDINALSIIAIEECETCAVEIKKFKAIAIKNRQILYNIMSFSTQMFKSSIYNFISLSPKNSVGRVATVILYLAENIYNSYVFTTTLSRQELAEFAGCSKEQVIHTLRDFYNDKILNISGKKIEILNVEKLRTISKYG